MNTSGITSYYQSTRIAKLYWQRNYSGTADVVPPTDPGIYTGNTNSLKSTYKQKLKLYEDYEEHRRNSNRAIQSRFDPDLLVELETDGLLLGITPMEVFQYMCDNFLQQVDKDREILKTRELLRAQYDPDRSVQHYYKNIR